MRGPRMSAQTLTVLEIFLAKPAQWRYGYDLSRSTGLKSGSLYPILMRLADHGWLEAFWEAPEFPGRPPRHIYRLTAEGVRQARMRVPKPRAAKARAVLTESRP